MPRGWERAHVGSDLSDHGFGGGRTMPRHLLQPLDDVMKGRQRGLNAGYADPTGLPPTYYNFVRIHKTLRTTPAMAANVTKRLWEIGDIVDFLEAWEGEN